MAIVLQRRLLEQRGDFVKENTPLGSVVSTSQESADEFWFDSPLHKSKLCYPFCRARWLTLPNIIGDRLKWKDTQIPAGRGLINRRNACFLNATVQALTYCPVLAQDSLSNRHSRRCQRAHENLYCGLCEFEKHVCSQLQQGQASTRGQPGEVRFYRTLHKDALAMFGVSTKQQHCAYEFFTLFIDWLRTFDLPTALESAFAMNKVPHEQLVTSYLGQIFSSIIRETKTCLTCKGVAKRWVTCNDYVLSVRGVKNVQEALNDHFESELLDKDNAIECDTCKSKQPKTWEKHIAVPPNVLVLTLRRTLWSSSSKWGLKKESKVVNAPLEMDISNLMVGHTEGANYASLENRYAVYSAIIHHGTASFGHYVSVSQAPNGQWYLFNDEKVSQIPLARLPTYLGSAYMLFYKRIGPCVPLPNPGDIARAHAEAEHKALGITPGESAPLDLYIGLSREASVKLRLPERAVINDVFASDASTTIGSDTSPSPCATFAHRQTSLASIRLPQRRLAFMTRFRLLRARVSYKLRVARSAAVFPHASSGSAQDVRDSQLTTKANSIPMGAPRRSIPVSVSELSTSQPLGLAECSRRRKDMTVETWDGITVSPEWLTQVETRQGHREALPVAKRHRHDIEYDRGKLKKKRESKPSIGRDQRSVFDSIQGNLPPRQFYEQSSGKNATRSSH